MPISTVHASGRGVTVRPFMQEVDPNTLPPRNLLEQAARCDDLNIAMRLVSDVLELETLRLAQTNLSEENRWRRLPKYARLQEIAGWLVAECYEVMDLIDNRGNSPMERVGTND